MGNVAGKKTNEIDKSFIESLITRDQVEEKGKRSIPKGVARLREGELSDRLMILLQKLADEERKTSLFLLEIFCCSYTDNLASGQACLFLHSLVRPDWRDAEETVLGGGMDLILDSSIFHLSSSDFESSTTTTRASSTTTTTTTTTTPSFSSSSSSSPSSSSSSTSTRTKMLRGEIASGHAWRYLAGEGYRPGMIKVFGSHKIPHACVLVVSDPRNCGASSDWDGQPPVPPVGMLTYLRSELPPDYPLVVCQTVGTDRFDPHCHDDSEQAQVVAKWCQQEALPYFRCSVGSDSREMRSVHLDVLRIAIGSFLLRRFLP